MKVKVSELTGAALDWAVAEAEGFTNIDLCGTVRVRDPDWPHFTKEFHPSTDDSQGGPIIDRKNISVLAPIVRRVSKERFAFDVSSWRAMIQRDENEVEVRGKGPTRLIAAMRCFVTSKLGAEVDVPEELL